MRSRAPPPRPDGGRRCRTQRPPGTGPGGKRKGPGLLPAPAHPAEAPAGLAAGCGAPLPPAASCCHPLRDAGPLWPRPSGLQQAAVPRWCPGGRNDAGTRLVVTQSPGPAGRGAAGRRWRSARLGWLPCGRPDGGRGCAGSSLPRRRVRELAWQGALPSWFSVWVQVS